jgi:hypothetical protein
VVRSNRVIAYLVRVRAIRGIDASIRLLILAQSSCLRAKGASLLSKALCLTAIRRRLSSRYCCGFPEEGIDMLLDLLEFNKVQLLLKKAKLGVFDALRRSALKFFRVFAMFAKETAFEGAKEEGA